MWRLLLLCTAAFGQEVTLGPFLQDPVDDAVSVVWHTAEDAPAVVQFGPGLSEVAPGETSPWGEGFRHVVRLEGLQGTWAYQVAGAEPATVRTPGDALRIVLTSDTQLDTGNPFAWERVAAAIAATEPHLLAIAGDLVDEAHEPSQWWGFHQQAPGLLASVPLLAVPGDEGSEDFVRHFVLPENGPPGWPEQSWTARFGSLLLIGLDTSEAAREPEVLGWLDEQLTGCAGTDFVLGLLHHPWRAELFTPDNNDFSGAIVARLEAWSTACDRPSLHVFGGAHGYSRGASRDARHGWLGPGSGGGTLDLWGTEPQEPVEQIAVSQPEYGFVVLDVEGGSLELSRWGLGTVQEPVEATLRERFSIEASGDPRPAPQLRPVDGGFELVDPGDIQAVQWRDCGGEATWIQDRNQYGGDDPAQERLSLQTDSACVQARVRDWSLNWSAWAESASLQVADCGCASGGGAAPMLLFLLLARRRPTAARSPDRPGSPRP